MKLNMCVECRPRSCTPSGCAFSNRIVPVVSAALRPPATVWQPFGLQLCIALVLLLTICLPAAAQQTSGPETWAVDNLKELNGHALSQLGSPQVISTPTGKAVLFNGTDQGLVIERSPVAGWKTFTVEAVFRPDSGGSKEQRWLHIQGDTRDDRVLLEIRLDGDQWFLDTFIKSGEHQRALYAENFKHATGAWYHVALVFDGSMMRHYVDGQEELSGPLEIAPLDVGKTSLGVRMNHVYWFKGAISRVRFTPRALTPKEFMKK